VPAVSPGSWVGWRAVGPLAAAKSAHIAGRYSHFSPKLPDLRYFYARGGIVFWIRGRYGLGSRGGGIARLSIGLALPLIAFAQNPPCGHSRSQDQVDDSVMRIDVNLVQLDAVVARIPSRLCTHPDADLVEVVCGRTSDDVSDAPAARYFPYASRGFYGQSSLIRVLAPPPKLHCWPRSRSIFRRGLG
jgi:hypothetical protein